MQVTVLFSTRNRAARLAATLEGLRATCLPSGVTWEIVVANNGSSDETDQVLSAWSERLPLRRVWVPEPGLSLGRNAALSVAQGELLIFTDDDVIVSSDWLAAYVRAYQLKGPAHYFGGPIDSEFEDQPPNTAWVRLAPPSVRGLDFGPEERELEGGEYFIGPNWACAAAPVRRVGGFDPRMGLGARNGPPGGEELDLMERLAGVGLRSWYVPAARLRHRVPADKTSEAHIRARWEAFAAVQAWKGTTRYNTFRVNRVPWRLYPDFVVAALQRAAAVAGVGDQLEAEVRFAWCRGLWKGFRLPPREPQDGSRD